MNGKKLASLENATLALATKSIRIRKGASRAFVAAPPFSTLINTHPIGKQMYVTYISYSLHERRYLVQYVDTYYIVIVGNPKEPNQFCM